MDFKEINRYFFSESIYCFTADIDWASECDIYRMLDIFKEYRIPLTPFITHNSTAINNVYKNLQEHVGLHPNFFPDSTKGSRLLVLLILDPILFSGLIILCIGRCDSDSSPIN